MSVLPAFRDALVLLRERPRLLGVLVPLSLLGTALQVVSSATGGVASLALDGVGLFVSPALTAAGVAATDRGFDGDSLEPTEILGTTALRYPAVLVATLAIVGGILLSAIVIALLWFVPVLNVLAVLVGVVGGGALLLALQFVVPAIVVDGTSARGGLVRSYAVAVDNYGSVVGYTLLQVGLGVALFVPLVALVFVPSPPPSTEALFDPTPLKLVTAAVPVVGSALLTTYHVTFYRRIAGQF